jgi:hypothetical protein
MANPLIHFTQPGSAVTALAGEAFDGDEGLPVTVANDQGASGLYYCVNAPQGSGVPLGTFGPDITNPTITGGVALGPAGPTATFVPDIAWGTWQIWLVVDGKVVARQDFIVGTPLDGNGPVGPNGAAYRKPALFSDCSTFNYGGQPNGWATDVDALLTFTGTASKLVAAGPVADFMLWLGNPASSGSGLVSLPVPVNTATYPPNTWVFRVVGMNQIGLGAPFDVRLWENGVEVASVTVDGSATALNPNTGIYQTSFFPAAGVNLYYITISGVPTEGIGQFCSATLVRT